MVVYTNYNVILKTMILENENVNESQTLVKGRFPRNSQSLSIKRESTFYICIFDALFAHSILSNYFFYIFDYQKDKIIYYIRFKIPIFIDLFIYVFICGWLGVYAIGLQPQF